MAKWYFIAVDNGGKHQCITVKASDKTEAIKKGFEVARKKAAGDITTWNCRLHSVL